MKLWSFVHDKRGCHGHGKMINILILVNQPCFYAMFLASGAYWRIPLEDFTKESGDAPDLWK